MAYCPLANIWNPACTYDIMEHQKDDAYHFTASSGSLTVFYKSLAGYLGIWEFSRQIDKVSGLLRIPRQLPKPRALPPEQLESVQTASQARMVEERKAVEQVQESHSRNDSHSCLTAETPSLTMLADLAGFKRTPKIGDLLQTFGAPKHVQGNSPPVCKEYSEICPFGRMVFGPLPRNAVFGPILDICAAEIPTRNHDIGHILHGLLH